MITGIVRVGLATLCLAYPSISYAIDLYADPKPQAQSDTCQSYALMLALAAQGDNAFPIKTFSELRKSEADFRAVAAGFPGGPFGHDALRRAVAAYTGGAYSLEIEDVGNDITKWMSRVRQLTLQKTTLGIFLDQLTGQNFPVILTSVTQFDESSYAGGHIMAVLGLAGSGLDSSTRIIAFNSAIQGGGSINQCEAGTQPGDMRYKAGVVSTNTFQLKSYPGFRILHLQRK